MTMAKTKCLGCLDIQDENRLDPPEKYLFMVLVDEIPTFDRFKKFYDGKTVCAATKRRVLHMLDEFGESEG